MRVGGQSDRLLLGPETRHPHNAGENRALPAPAWAASSALTGRTALPGVAASRDAWQKLIKDNHFHMPVLSFLSATQPPQSQRDFVCSGFVEHTLAIV